MDHGRTTMSCTFSDALASSMTNVAAALAFRQLSTKNMVEARIPFNDLANLSTRPQLEILTTSTI